MYLATNPDCRWHKFGHSADLAGRLNNDGYVLTYPRPWQFVWVFVLETPGKDSAFALEQIVLETCKVCDLLVRRENGGYTELVRANPDQLKAVVAAVAAETGLVGAFVDPTTLTRPVPPPAPKRAQTSAANKLRKQIAALPTHLLNATAAPVAAAAEPIVVAGNELIAPEPIALVAAPAAPEADPDIGPPVADQIRIARIEQEYYQTLIDQLPPAGARAAPLRPYQLRAVAAAQQHFGPPVAGQRGRRGYWTMCCRSGKTNTALGLLEANALPGHTSLYFAPWLSLIAQTAPKLALAGLGGPDSRFSRVLLVGSLPDPVALPAALGGSARMTTDPARVAAFLRESARHPGSSLILSSYCSSHIVVAALSAADTPIDYVVYDEAHHLCAKYKPPTAEADPPLPYFLHAHHFFFAQPGSCLGAVAGPLAAAAHQLYMTGTPCRTGGGESIHMRMPEHFGPELIRYTLGDGVREGFVNPYRFVLLGGGFEGEYQLSARNKRTMFWPLEVLSRLILQTITTSPQITRLLVKCRVTSDCNALRDLCRAAAAKIEFYSVHTSQGSDNRVNAILALGDNDPARRVVVFQCKCLSEGVELPRVNAVFVAHPMSSPVDIIQFVSRALTHQPGKPESVVYHPFLYRVGEPLKWSRNEEIADENADPADTDNAGDDGDNGDDVAEIDDPEAGAAPEINPEVAAARAELEQFTAAIANASDLERGRNWRSIGNFIFVIEALMAEDRRFFDFLSGAIDPAVSGIDWCRGASLAAPALDREELLRYCRFRVTHGSRSRPGAATTNRMFKFGVFPFDRGFRQLQLTTNTKRYPKTRDAFLDDPTRTAKFRTWYLRCRDEYIKFISRQPSLLEPHQVAALRTLPHWDLYGIYGPYPEHLLLSWLEDNLAAGATPIFSIGNGEQVHFEATLHQRLSGLMRIINQQDGAKKLALRTDSNLFRRMDEICRRHGLRWLKQRRGGFNSALVQPRSKNPVPETFIQKANEEFTRLAKEPDNLFMRSHFPGYGTPAYAHQEHPDFYGTDQMIPSVVDN